MAFLSCLKWNWSLAEEEGFELKFCFELLRIQDEEVLKGGVKSRMEKAEDLGVAKDGEASILKEEDPQALHLHHRITRIKYLNHQFC